MDWVSIVSLIVSTLSLPTLVGFIWRYLYEKRKENSEQNKAQKKRDQQNMFRAVIKEEMQPLENKVDQLVDRLDEVGEGTLSSLRNDILKCYYECVRKGYRNDYDYTNIHDLFEAYCALHGNSFIRDVMGRFDSLPTKEEYQEVHHDVKKEKANDE